jgi:hypothetical protein
MLINQTNHSYRFSEKDGQLMSGGLLFIKKT